MPVPCRVLHTITSLDVGGGQAMLARYIDRMDRGRYSSTVLSMRSPGEVATEIASTGTPVVSLNMRRTVPLPHHALRLRRITTLADPDLIHGWLYHGDLAASAAAMLGARRPPVIWSIHHSLADMANEKPASRLLIHLLARLSSSAVAICYCSRISAAQHERIGFNAARRIVIPNGIDPERFTIRPPGRRRLRDMIGIDKERIIVGNVARFHPMKDQTSLVRALSRLVAEGLDLHGVFIGHGHENGVVADAARKLGVADRVTILGGRSDVAELLPELDVFTLCSAWGEAFPLALGEAMACGIPCIATDVGDAGWLLGKEGIVVPPSDPEALAAAIRRIACLGAAERAALGRRARQRVTECFSLSMYVSRHEDMYAEVLAAARSREAVDHDAGKVLA